MINISKATTLLIVLLLTACASPDASENTAASPGSDIPATAIRQTFEGQPGIEKISINDANGVLATRGNLVNGKKEGLWADFFPSGLVKSTTSFIGGRKEGVAVELTIMGSIVKVINYHNDLKEGEYKEFNSTTLKEERSYKNDKLNGTVKLYYPDGKLMEEGVYKNGTRDGTSKWYNNEGKMTIEYEYKEGQLIKK